MKILCITSRLERPSTQYRLLKYIPYINSAGIETNIVALQNMVHKWLLFNKAGEYDGVFIQKKLFSRLEQWYLRKKAKVLIYDFDDAIMYTNSRYSEKTRRYKRFKYMLRIADLVIAGNKYLKEISGEKYYGKIDIIPTVVQASDFSMHIRKDKDVILGWIGTKSTQMYLNILQPLFDKLLQKYPFLKIKIVSDEKPGFINNRIIWQEWSKTGEMEQLQSFDIGLMPLTDDPWARGKCGFKIIQYMAAGIPVVCSPVGINNEIVSNGYNGFLAAGLNEWESKTGLLIEDIGLYGKISKSARQTIEQRYNLSYWGPYLANLIKEKLC